MEKLHDSWCNSSKGLTACECDCSLSRRPIGVLTVTGTGAIMAAPTFLKIKETPTFNAYGYDEKLIRLASDLKDARAEIDRLNHKIELLQGPAEHD